VTPALLVDIKEACRLTSLSRTAVYDLTARGQFPVPIHINTRTRWSRAEIEQWVSDRLAERRTA
jgi:prophage regulatory protein